MIERFRPYLEGKPVIANMDFGHSTPLLTIPVGGTAVIDEGKVRYSLYHRNIFPHRQKSRDKTRPFIFYH